MPPVKKVGSKRLLPEDSVMNLKLISQEINQISDAHSHTAVHVSCRETVGLNNTCIFIHRKYIHVSTIHNGTGSDSKQRNCSARTYSFINTIQILCIGTDRSQQTVQTKIRLLLKKQSDQGLRCLPFHQHLLDALMRCYIKLFYF